MRVRVEYTAQLRAVVGRADEEFELAEGASLVDLFVRVASEQRREAAPFLLTDGGEVQRSLLVAINKQAVSVREAGNVRVNAGDVITIMPPIAGG